LFYCGKGAGRCIVKRFGNIQFRRADHLRWRRFDPTRDKIRGDQIPDNLLVPVRAEDSRDEGGLIMPKSIQKAPCLPDLTYGGDRSLTKGPWKEHRGGWGVYYTRALYLIEDGVVWTGTERRDIPPVEA